MKRFFALGLAFVLSMSFGIIEGRFAAKRVTPLGEIAFYILSPFEKIINSLTAIPFKISSYFRSYSSLKRENALLKQILSAYRQEFVSAQEAILEKQRLEKILSLKTSLPLGTISARVIARVPGSHTFVIDKGKDDGVEAGKAVIAPEGLVGRVIKIAKDTAIVMTLTHPQSGVGAMVQSSREVGIIKGTGDSFLLLTYLPYDARINQGDVIITSGMGGTYPKGILIGEIVRIREEKHTFSVWADVKPAVNFNRLEEVLVLK